MDDEKPSREILKKFIDNIPSLKLVAECYNAIQVIEITSKESIDIIFLDIEMPDMTGVELLKILHNKPLVVFTTAYDKYALTGYDLGVIDYLLKPFSFERFVIAVQKCFYNLKSDRLIKSDSGELPYLLIKVDKDIKRFDINSIYYFKSFGNYTKLFLQNREILCSEPLSKIEIKVSDHNFIRVHRSYIISKSKITNILSNAVCLDNYSVPLGNRYKLNL
ncbi:MULTISPECIES: LytR/AlgR family response regulator transcription factor [Flavobacterium]|uniref:Response regulator transcription factor n=1 Tax=Flavobacterium macrobrachii TaxID=591204 RepID=A0ABS2CTA0_9FLAO|nr:MULTISPECIES: response regulator transcription factor [Flavobacterium]MBM6498129.1 response regulator transcription factor [Flavobacterium macrobrachii]MCZ8296574.1 response regulator transcription factor [Flavobacterium sp.]